MAGDAVNGNGKRARAGTQTLALLAVPSNPLILRALEDGPKRQTALRQAAGSPAQTTLRMQLRRLIELEAIARHPRDRFPGVVDYELTHVGEELLAVANLLERWLELAPDGPLALGSPPASAAVKALTEGWSTTMVRVLAAGPRALTQLDGVIDLLSYPSLERRLAAMRLAGLVEAVPNSGRGTPYAVSDWLRTGIGPLASAAWWEHRYDADNSPSFRRLDIEATLLLVAPLLRLPSDLTGSCRLAAEIGRSHEPGLAGLLVEVDGGRITSFSTRLQGDPSAWILGPPRAWLNAIAGHEADGLELGGDGHLARTLLHALHETLFRIGSQTRA